MYKLNRRCIQNFTQKKIVNYYQFKNANKFKTSITIDQEEIKLLLVKTYYH